VRAVFAWSRDHAKTPVGLAGTGGGTQSVGYLATQLVGHQGPDGIVLTATTLRDDRGRPPPVADSHQRRRLDPRRPLAREARRRAAGAAATI